MKTTLFLAGFTLVCSVSALATEECHINTQGPVKDVLFTAQINCALGETLSETLREASLFSPRQPVVTLIIGDRAGNASFDNGAAIRVPQELFFTDSTGLAHPSSQDQLAKVVVHEYGHAVLKEIWRTEFSTEFGTLFDELTDLSYTSTENIKNKISSRGIRHKGQQIAATEAYSLFYKSLPAYSELYADTLTVLFFADAAAMFEALHFAHLSEEKALSVELRDFSREHPLRHLEQSNDAHTRLSLVRSYLGRKMKSLDLAGRRSLLKQLGQAVTQAAREELQNPGASSILEQNLRLIELLQDLDPAAGPSKQVE